MRRRPRVFVRLLVTCFLTLILDSCLFRDPGVHLANGYSIGAISPGSPCSMAYSEAMDSRPRSPWRMHEIEQSYTLYNLETNEFRDFASKEECREAARRLGARPPPDLVRIRHVTRFDSDGRYVIGDSLIGYFILDTGADEFDTFPTAAEWASAVRARTSLNPERLRSPTDRLIQYREPVLLVFLGFFLALGLFWSAAPLFWKSRRPDKA